jgi:hypothetical protein
MKTNEQLEQLLDEVRAGGEDEVDRLFGRLEEGEISLETFLEGLCALRIALANRLAATREHLTEEELTRFRRILRSRLGRTPPEKEGK